MRKKIIHILCWSVCIVFVCTAVWFLCAFFGNPVSSALAKSTAKRHLEENYPEADFKIIKVSYDMKSGGYNARVESSSSADSHFIISMDGLGRYQDDTYECITNGSNTFSRVHQEYWDLVRAKLPYDHFAIDIGHGELRAAGTYEIFDYTDENGEHKHYTLTKDYGLDISTLVLDGEYDILALGREHGALCVYIEDETITIERTAEVLLDLKTILDEQGLPFYAIDFTLCAPRNADGMREGPSIRLIEFLYSDIYEEGLIDRVAHSWNITQEHYAIQDSEKVNAELIYLTEIHVPEE